jgi:hypothetical protein
MAQRTFRDVLGEPSTWTHTTTSSRHRPDMRDATVLETFSIGSKVSLYTRSVQYGETLSVFHIPDGDLRARVLRALRPGSSVLSFLATAV